MIIDCISDLHGFKPKLDGGDLLIVPDAENRNGAMFFPPKSEYVNLQKYCFHVHEVPLDTKTCFPDRNLVLHSADCPCQQCKKE